jgi:hypothetical protein
MKSVLVLFLSLSCIIAQAMNSTENRQDLAELFRYQERFIEVAMLADVAQEVQKLEFEKVSGNEVSGVALAAFNFACSGCSSYDIRHMLTIPVCHRLTEARFGMIGGHIPVFMFNRDKINVWKIREYYRNRSEQVSGK